MKKALNMIAVLLLSAMLLASCGGTAGDNGNAVKLEGSLETIMADIEKQLDMEIATSNDPIDLNDDASVKYHMGVDDASGIEEALASNAMMSTHAYSAILIRVKSVANAEELAKKMVDNVDLMKWICVGADDVQAAVYGDLIYLVMLDSGLGVNSIEDHFKALEKVAGSEVETIVKR